MFRESPESVQNHILAGLLSKPNEVNKQVEIFKSVAVANNNMADVTIGDIHI